MLANRIQFNLIPLTSLQNIFQLTIADDSSRLDVLDLTTRLVNPFVKTTHTFWSLQNCWKQILDRETG